MSKDDLSTGAAATDPGALSEVAAATDDEAVDAAMESSQKGYTDGSTGDDEPHDHARGAGRSTVSDITSTGPLDERQ